MWIKRNLGGGDRNTRGGGLIRDGGTVVLCHVHIAQAELVAVALIGTKPLPSGQHVLLTAITWPRYQMSFCCLLGKLGSLYL